MIMYYLKRPAILPIRSDTFAKNNPLVPRLILSNEMQKEFNDLPTSDQEKLNKALVGRNGLVVEYSPVQSAVVGCNTNASLLGSDAQTKAALCYVLKYVTKPPAELAHSLSLLHHARRTIELHPSKAADTGSVIRTGMHYLNRIVNQLNGAIEISAPMAAVAIQGMPAELCSDSFWVAYITAAIAYAKHHPETVGLSNKGTSDEFDDVDANNSSMDELEKDNLSDERIIMEEDNDILNSEEFATDQVLSHDKEIPIDTTLQAEDHEDIVVNNDNSEIEPTLDEFFSQTEPMILSPEEQHRLTTQSDEGVISTATINVADKKIVAVPQHLHYAFRGPHFSILSLFEYVALIDVVPKHWEKASTDKTGDEPDTGGRAFNATFTFMPTHPLHGK
jgi:hypothetical protein